MRRFVLAVTIAAALAVTSTACSASAGSRSVPKDQVEKEGAAQLEKVVGQRPELDCPKDLPAEVGATIRCTLIAPDGSTIGSTVTVDAVDGKDVKFNVQVDDL